MARRRRGRKGKGRRGKGISILGFAFPIYYVSKVYDRYKSGYELKRMWVPMLYDLTGYDVGTKQWDSKVPMENVGIILASAIGHKVANKMGVNAKLGGVSKKLLGFRITL